MATTVKIIGIAIVFMAVVYLLKPDVFKRIMEFFKQGRRIYFAGLLRFVLAVVFLLAANDCKRPWVIISLGILFIISGLLVFTLGLEKLKAMIEWYQKQSTLLLRVIALIALAIGALIISST
ncbi:MAG: hypothetical protein ACYS1A_14900 [Planctomycetota bacterium]|jgi:uncharacterized protein YjeT (DUF2065 family)